MVANWCGACNGMIKKAILITNYHCNLACQYCNVAALPKKVLDTDTLIECIDALVAWGIGQVHFIGGEPYLRKDLGRLLAAAKARGLRTVVHSNGKFVRPLTDAEIDPVDEFVTCLNGLPHVHEQSRGKDTYGPTLAAIRSMRAAGVSVVADMILNVANSDWRNIDHVLTLARLMRFKVSFQPVFEHQLVAAEAPLVDGLKVAHEQIKRIFAGLLRRHEPEVMFNSEAYLRAVASHAAITFEECHHGRQSLVVDPAGRVARCFKYVQMPDGPSGLEFGWAAAFERVRMTDCVTCAYTIHAEDNLRFAQDDERRFAAPIEPEADEVSAMPTLSAAR